MSRTRTIANSLMTAMPWLAVLPMLIWPAFAHGSCCCVGRMQAVQQVSHQAVNGTEQLATERATQSFHPCSLGAASGQPLALANEQCLTKSFSESSTCPRCYQAGSPSLDLSAAHLNLEPSPAPTSPTPTNPVAEIAAACHCFFTVPSLLPAIRADGTQPVNFSWVIAADEPLCFEQASVASTSEASSQQPCATAPERCALFCRWLN